MRSFFVSYRYNISWCHMVSVLIYRCPLYRATSHIWLWNSGRWHSQCSQRPSSGDHTARRAEGVANWRFLICCQSTVLQVSSYCLSLILWASIAKHTGSTVSDTNTPFSLVLLCYHWRVGDTWTCHKTWQSMILTRFNRETSFSHQMSKYIYTANIHGKHKTLFLSA